MESSSKRNLVLLWIAQLVSQMGDFVYATSVVFLVMLIVPVDDGASWKAGLVSFLETAPFLAFGLVAGALADRLDRRRLMLASDGGRAFLLLVCFPLLYYSGHLSWWSLGALTFLLGVFSTPFNPSRDALVGEIVPREALLRVNSIFQTSQQLAMILGTMIAGAFLAARTGTNETDAIAELFLLNGGSFLASFGLIALMRLPRTAPREGGAGQFLQELKLGVQRVGRDRLLFWLLALTAIDNFFIMGPAVIGANLYIRNTLGLGAAELAWFICLMAIGWFAGTLFLLKWGDRFDKLTLLAIGMVADGLTYVPFYWIESYRMALLVIALHGVCIPFISAIRTALIQERVERQMLGRVFSMVNLTVVGFTAVSLLATGIAGELVSPPVLFLIAGSGGAACGLVGTMALLASVREQRIR